MINILYDLQLSVLTSLQDGDFLFDRDSNVNVASFTIAGLLEKNPEYHFYLLVPEKDKVELLQMTEDIDMSRVTFIEYPYFGNPFVERVSFNPRELMKALENVKIDLVYTNDPSKVLQYKTFFYMKQDEFVPIMSRNHWVTGKAHRKVPEEIDFIIRQVEGAIHSDISTFNSNAAVNFLLENATEHFNDKTIKDISDKLHAIETVSNKKLDKYEATYRNEKTIFLFAHRLSYYTGFEEVFEVLEELYKEGYDFELIAPDPGDKFNQSELKSKYPFLREIDKSKWSHEDYVRACWEADVAIGNHNIPTTWGGLALTEPMYAKTAIAMPDKDGYREMSYDTGNRFTSKDDMRELLIRYIEDKNFLKEQKALSRKFATEELSMDKYLNTINSLIMSLMKK